MSRRRPTISTLGLRVMATKVLREPGCHVNRVQAWEMFRAARDAEDEVATALWSRVLFRLARPRLIAMFGERNVSP
jgi:hypothetical protein